MSAPKSRLASSRRSRLAVCVWIACILSLGLLTAGEDVGSAEEGFELERHEELDKLEDAFPRPSDDSSEPSPSLEPVRNEEPSPVVESAPTIDASPESSAPVISPAAAENPTKRQDPRTAKLFASTGPSPMPRQTAGDDNGPIDDYYGLTTSPIDNLNTMAFQPDHILAFVVPPAASDGWLGSGSAEPAKDTALGHGAAGHAQSGTGEVPQGVVEFYHDAALEDIGRGVRGDWFVTSSGDESSSSPELSLEVSIVAPDGNEVYHEGPYDLRDGQPVPVGEGSFSFLLPRPGTYTIRFRNPSSVDRRTVTFAWLVGRDHDDPYTTRYGEDTLNADDEGEDEGLNAPNRRYGGWPDPSAPPRAGAATADEAGAARSTAAGQGSSSGPGQANSNGSSSNKNSLSEYVRRMLRRASRLHKRLDALNAQLQFADVRFARHLSLTANTARKVHLWSAIETLVVLIVAIGQLAVIRGFGWKENRGRNPYV